MALAIWASAVLVCCQTLGSPSFHGPLFLPVSGRIRATGDLHGDGRREIVLSEERSLTTLFQDPTDRTSWASVSFSVGLYAGTTEIADFDNDGRDDVVGTTSPNVLFMRGRGNGEFETATASRAGTNPLISTAGDWNEDGTLDLAVTTEAFIAVLLGEGDGSFSSHEPIVLQDHGVEALDADGDGLEDLVAAGSGGLVTLRGNGTGAFEVFGGIGLDCSVGSPSVGDLDGDRRDDVVVSSCVDGTAPDTLNVPVSILLSRRDGTFTRTAVLPSRNGANAIGDMDLDGKPDVLTLTGDLDRLAVTFHRGRGDGTAAPPLACGLAGGSILVSDLDGDGFQDVVTGGMPLTILWGKAGSKPLESAPMTTGYRATSVAMTDIDGDLMPDLICNRVNAPGVDIYLDPADRDQDSPSSSIPTRAPYSKLIAADLDGNGASDVVGTSLSTSPGRDSVLVTLRDPGGAVREDSYTVGGRPSAIASGRLHGDDVADLVVACQKAHQLAVLQGAGNGKFIEARMRATLPSPEYIALGDIDADGKTDVAVRGAFAAAIHFGAADHVLEDALMIVAGGDVAHLTCGEFTGDGVDDVTCTLRSPPMLLLLHGNRSRSFAAPQRVELSAYPVVMAASDADADGILDIVSADELQNAFLRLGKDSFRDERRIRLPGILERCIALEMRDLDADGTVDFGVLGGRRSYFFEGKFAEPFVEMRRGDFDLNGRVDMTDPIALLDHLFRGGAGQCEDPGDTNDDGKLDLTDAMAILAWLFRGGEPPPSPGPFACGPDATLDTLSSCRECSH